MLYTVQFQLHKSKLTIDLLRSLFVHGNLLQQFVHYVLLIELVRRSA